MKKIFIGIDISKEKLNLCYMNAKEIVLEVEVENTIPSIKRQIKNGLKDLGSDISEALVCAEYTGRYIFPLLLKHKKSINIRAYLTLCHLIS